jgi:hypothetical protein
VKKEPPARDVRVRIDVVDPSGIEGTGSPDQAVDLIPLEEQKLRQIGSVLTCNSRNQSAFHPFFLR